MPSSQLQSHLGRVKRAICRHVPKSISGGLSSNKGVYSNNVDYSRAVDQHAVYMERLCDAVGRGKDGIYVCDADDKHPDCVFVEDAAVVSSPTNAVSTSIGAESRRGEEGDVLDALYDSGITKVLNMRDIEGAYLDGGDVLYTGKHVFVGLSTRTNMQGCELLRKNFPDRVPVVPVPVMDNLHFKCSITAIDESNLVVADTGIGRSLMEKAFDLIGSKDAADYTVHLVENDIAANVVRCNHTIIVPEGVGKETMKVYEHIARTVPGIDKLVVVENTEFTKIDGSLTCRSVLLWNDD